MMGCLDFYPARPEPENISELGIETICEAAAKFEDIEWKEQDAVMTWGRYEAVSVVALRGLSSGIGSRSGGAPLTDAADGACFVVWCSFFTCSATNLKLYAVCQYRSKVCFVPNLLHSRGSKESLLNLAISLPSHLNAALFSWVEDSVWLHRNEIGFFLEIYSCCIHEAFVFYLRTTAWNACLPNLG